MFNNRTLLVKSVGIFSLVQTLNDRTLRQNDIDLDPELFVVYRVLESTRKSIKIFPVSSETH